MPKICLKAQPRAGQQKKSSFASLVNIQIGNFCQNEDLKSLLEAHKARKFSKKMKGSARPDLISSKIDEGNIRGAISIASSADEMEPPNIRSLEVLKTKHPEAPNDRRPFSTPSDDNDPLQMSIELARDDINSFAPGSAGGPSGLQPQHLKDCISRAASEAGNKALTAITSLVNIILTDLVSSEIAPVLFSANLFALKKKDGGVRPISVGETLRRLSAKSASKMVYHNLTKYFSPLQMRAGTPNGAKTAAHAARSFLSAAKDDDIFIKLDFKNAFNTLKRDAIADSILQLAPELDPFFLTSYKAHSSLVHGDYVIDYQEGFQQGDPIASVGFCMVTQLALTSMQSQFKLLYLDDISAGDSWKIVLPVLQIFQEQARALGLNLNSTKCELTIIGSNKEYFARVRESVPRNHFDWCRKSVPAWSPSRVECTRSRSWEKKRTWLGFATKLWPLPPNKPFS